MKKTAALLVLSCFLASTVSAQDKPKMAMSKDAMMAKMKMMDPAMMKQAETSMLGENSMLPLMVAKEMLHLEMMQNKEAMGMMEKSAMMMDGDDKMMLREKHIRMANEKMRTDPDSMQMMFQQLVARHIATKKMALMMKAEPTMESMAGKAMKSMMMDKEAMMMTKKRMMDHEENAMMMARESLMDSLSHDPEIMKLIENESMKLMDGSMAPMMQEKMKMASDMMMKDKDQMLNMTRESVIRQMIKNQKKMMSEK